MFITCYVACFIEGWHAGQTIRIRRRLLSVLVPDVQGFSLRNLKALVLDEADRLLNLDFEQEIDQILKVIPSEDRRTLLFSATMTTKVAKLQRACLVNPVKVRHLQTPPQHRYSRLVSRLHHIVLTSARTLLDTTVACTKRGTHVWISCTLSEQL